MHSNSFFMITRCGSTCNIRSSTFFDILKLFPMQKAAQLMISERLFIILLLIFFFFISPGRRGILHGCDLAFFDTLRALRHK